MSDPSAAEMLADGPDSVTNDDADAEAQPPPQRSPCWSQDELSQLIGRYEGQLLAYARRMLGGDWQAAQDAVQETFLRLCREDREKIAARVQPWLFAVCRSRVIDMQRTKHAHPIDAAEITVQDPHPDAPAAALAAEQADATESRLAVLVSRLSKRQQEVLRLRMQAGLSYREIAEVTGLTVSNVGFHLHAAVRSLKDAVATT
ncbi:RNA polymerase sigma factor [Rhodopirellula sp. JC639]|uniref:RNA polymerase sigma factor n=1 Tax=Stieleria mannarensis TaxID=2755585 RepID=UPI00160051E7|nr:sigma-70 family RNA polymerase sigma factor [Rhodopirellula sp. JC639]